MFTNRPRKPWLAGFLTFLTIGLGHIYSGEAKKGIILYFIQAILAIAILALLMMKIKISTLAISLIIAIGYFSFCLIDSIKTAKLNRERYYLKNYNRWYAYLAIYVFAVLIIQPSISYIIRDNITQAYKIPSGAMAPTLFIGDHILVNKYVYKNHPPERGDIIVFQYPRDPSIDYVKRLVAKQGDLVEIKDKQLFINSIAQSEKYVQASDKIIDMPNFSQRDNFGPITVPEDSFFVLGDNRDNSADSRFWGFVSNDHLKGKVTTIYWSWDLQYPLISKARWKSIRWERIGKSLE